MKSCSVCHLLNNDEETRCGNCGTPLSSRECSLSDDEERDIKMGVLKHWAIPGLGLMDIGLLIAALVRGTFQWEMLLILLLQAIGIADLFFPDVMFRFTYGLLIRDVERVKPGDYYYFRAGCSGFILLIGGIAALAIFTFRNV
jgi:hypothetical protein